MYEVATTISRELFETIVGRLLDEIEDLTHERAELRADNAKLERETTRLEEERDHLEQQQLQQLDGPS